MRFGIIAGENFFKTSSQYIARLIVEKLIEKQHEVFVFNKTNFSINITGIQTIKVEGALSKMFSANLFEQRTIKNLLRQYAIDKLMVFETGDIVKTEIPQVLVLNNDVATDADTLQKLAMVNHVITFSETLQQKISHLKPELVANTIVSAVPIADGIQTFSYNEKLAAREQFAQEKPYFVYTDFEIDKAGFLNLLKAFSAFKKMQQTNWKLVVYLRSRFATKELEEIIQPLSNFKYRNDVNIVNNQDESTLAECLSGAYAHISTAERAAFNIQVLEALLTGIPSLAPRSEVTSKYAGGILEITNNTPETLADQMMNLYKNEALRSLLSQNAEELKIDFDKKANLNGLVTTLLN